MKQLNDLGRPFKYMGRLTVFCHTQIKLPLFIIQ